MIKTTKALILFVLLGIVSSCTEGGDTETAKSVGDQQIKSAPDTIFQLSKPDSMEYLVSFSTPKGEMLAIFYDITPKHKANFINLVKGGFYDSTTFHRVIDNFMIQGGDLNSKDTIRSNDGRGSLGYRISSEIRSTLRHKYGAIAAARMDDSVNPLLKSNASQFYIVENHSGTPMLNNRYTVFGRVIKGLSVIDSIASVKTDENNRPLNDVHMIVDVRLLPKKEIEELTGYQF